MAKNKKEEKKEVMTDVQIKVDNEKRMKAVNEEIGKLCEKYEVQLVPVLDGYPMRLVPSIKIVSTKKYEEAEPAKK
jgi:hypothetical protein